MSQPASVALITARTMLNDDAANLWSDTVLMPKLAQAHRELQAMLKLAAAPVMRVISGDLPVAISATTVTNPADMVEPIRLWERLNGDPVTAKVQMTESDPLPIQAVASSLIYWQWMGEIILFIGASTNRFVNIQYWRSLPVPTANTDLLGFINAELYLAPRTAALAAGSVGNKELYDTATAVGKETIGQVILSNHGRVKGDLRP